MLHEIDAEVATGEISSRPRQVRDLRLSELLDPNEFARILLQDCR
jgi:hypothetical protein